MNCVSFIWLHLSSSISLPAWTCAIFSYWGGGGVTLTWGFLEAIRMLHLRQKSWGMVCAVSELLPETRTVMQPRIIRGPLRLTALSDLSILCLHCRQERPPILSACPELLRNSPWLGFMENRLEELLQHVAPFRSIVRILQSGRGQHASGGCTSLGKIICTIYHVWSTFSTGAYQAIGKYLVEFS